MPRFITFEGIDGAGKSSHVTWLADLLRESQEVVCTREPGGTTIGEHVRKLFLADSMDPDAELLLAFASRQQHLRELIEPQLAKGRTIISDRFTDSTYAFQGGGRGIPWERIQAIESWCNCRQPDLTLFFDVPVEIASERITGRDQDRFEKEKVEFHQRVRDAFLRRAAENPDRIKIIDATQTMDQVRLAIRQAVQ